MRDLELKNENSEGRLRDLQVYVSSGAEEYKIDI